MIKMELGLEGKTALVTGGSAGIGFAISEMLVQEGANVIVASREFENVERAVKHLRRINPAARIAGKAMDLSDAGKIARGIEQLLKKVEIDILVNNVGGPVAGATLEIDLQGWDRGYQTLLRSVIQLSKQIVPGMAKKKWGRILTITSTSAREMIPKLPVSGVFRAGLTSFTKSLAKDVGRQGILVNNLLPGPTNTARLKDLKKKSPAFFESMATETALGRIAETDEIARVALFLCSQANSYITGTDILADGGYTKSL